MNQVFHELRDRSAHTIFRLSHEARQELLLLVLSGPFMVTDLRAEPLERIYATDASGFAAGACQSRISKAACLELIRHADHRGFLHSCR